MKQTREQHAGPLIRRKLSRIVTLALLPLIAFALFQNVTNAEEKPAPLKPIGTPVGIHPGRVVWVHDTRLLNWNGPGDGHWWEKGHVDQARMDAMLDRAICELTGKRTVEAAWDQLFRYFNSARGKGSHGYKPGEKIAIKPNWVGLIHTSKSVDQETYALKYGQDYMNTSPQIIIALLRQLTSVGVKQRDITVSDTLARIPNEYYNILTNAFPEVRYEDFDGKFGRIKVQPSTTRIYWSTRPADVAPDYLPTCFAETDYIINLANFKAHNGGGVTLCAKNHFGSLIRWPNEKSYYNIHPNCFSKEPGIYRPQVDLMGHSQLGGKTVLCLIDGMFSGVHPSDHAPRRMQMAPFNGNWPCSVFASQDPVAIDSVAFDFLSTEYPEVAVPVGVDDYLHEAAQANNPPSATFYDPDHASPTKRLASLGVHEHWNNAQDKKYSRNLRKGKGIELIPVELSVKP